MRKLKVILQCLMCISALAAAGERAMGADMPEESLAPSSEMSYKGKDSVKEAVSMVAEGPKSGTIEHHQDIPSEYFPPRPVEVWLPEGYDPASEIRYPVLYMHDGQFLFHHGRTPFTEKEWLWDVDIAMARLIESGEIRPAIVVAAWANLEKPNRQLEYMPQKPINDEVRKAMIARESELAGKKVVSDNYLKFLVSELKPFIDKTYRTQPDRENTFISGSSMGGMISAYAIAEYPEIFGGAACLSTDWVTGGEAMIDWYNDHWPDTGKHRIYFDHGTETLDADYEPYQKRMDEVVRSKGFQSGMDWVTRKFDGADHSPRAWRERFQIPLIFLLGTR